MISRRNVILVSVMCVFVTAPPAARAYSEYNIPLSVRSLGMGETGTADTSNVANVAYNPALVSMLTSVQFTYGFRDFEWGFNAIEHVSGGVIGGGHRIKIGGDFCVGAGAAAGYAERKFGLDERLCVCDEIDWITQTSAWHFAGGAMAGYREFAYAGVGLSVKRYETIYDRLLFLPGGVCYPVSKSKASPVDAGAFVRLVPYRRDGFFVTTTGGFTYFHAAGEVTSGINCPVSTVIQPARYAFRRYALNFSLSTPPWDKSLRYFETTVPLLTLSASFDYHDPVDRRSTKTVKYMGAELGLIGTVFLRAGLVSEEHDPGNNNTFGVGITFNKKRAHARFDYARMPEPSYTPTHNSYGFTFEVDL